MATLPTGASASGDSRVDEATGVREIVDFIESDDQRIFACTYLPETKPLAAVLICSPLLADLHVTYRREVLTGRELAARGFAVQRFHYRGSTNSGGSPEASNLADLVIDGQRAGERLEQNAGIQPTVVVGTRLGAMIAAKVAGIFDASSLVMWSPTLDAAGYFRDVFRGYMIGQLKDGRLDGKGASDPVRKLRREGSLDVLGYPFGQPLYDSLVDRHLIDEMSSRARNCLLIQVGGNALSSSYLRFARQMRDRGMAVDTSVVAGREAWWFGGGATLREDEARVAREVSARTVDWVERNCSLLGCRE
jgi:hypothetical protein